ncbi:MAG: zinc-dependent alcohol dehydrogenase family protein [Gemmatimonadales bacterium]
MRAAIYHAFRGPIEICDVPDPELLPDSAIVRVEATGVCRSDYHGWQGHDPSITLPHVPGHELAGIIEELGSEVDGWQVGQRVTVPFVAGCGACPQCLSGNQQICDRQEQPGFTCWGSFAERVMIRYAAGNLVALPDEVASETAASLGCRFTTAWRAVVVQGRARPGEWVAVHGCGGVGLSAVMIASGMGARVVAIDVQRPALDLARDVGAEVVVDATESSDVVAAIEQYTDGGADLSLDALGSATTCGNSIACLRKRGRHVQVGIMVADEREHPVPMDRVIARELEIKGSHGMQAHGFAPLLAMIVRGTIDPARLIKQRVNLVEGVNVLTRMGEDRHSGITVIGN